MDKDQAKGKTKEMMGAAQKKTGEMTGQDDMEAKGAAREMEGKAQGAYGKGKDAAKEMADKARH